VQFSLPAGSYVSNFYLDVDATAAQLDITISASGGADVDLFVRYGTPFPSANSTSFPTSPQIVGEDTLNRWSHYHAISGESTDSISVLRSSRVPLAAGRWYVAVINADSKPGTVTLTATPSATQKVASIAVDFATAGTTSDPCDIAPWNDATAATPIGGNPGTTLGAQRRNALTYAVEQISQSLQPPVPITIHACWQALGGTANSATIARASPSTFLVDEPYFGGYILPQRYTWYAITEAVRQGGTPQCGLFGGPCSGTSDEEVSATFNSDIGSPDIIGGRKFYYGLTPGANSNNIDFVSVAMHELTHGMGFIGLANTDDSQGPIGAKAGVGSNSIGYQNLDRGPYDDIFDDQVAIVDSSTTWHPFLGYEVNGSGDADRAAALVSGNFLRWSEATAVDSTINLNRGLPAPQSFPGLYAPNPISNGSTLSHTTQSGDLMNAMYNNAVRTTGLSTPMLAPLGWGSAAVAAPVYGQPFPSNWYDRSHSGHGIDFQLARRDPVYGDVYILVFYTYDANGVPEWYLAIGNIVDGVFVGSLDENSHSLLYSTYGTDLGVGQLNPTPQANVYGSVVVDFNQAANSPVCRDVDRSGVALLGVMSWAIGSTSEDWCLEPLVGESQRATPDYTGHWYAPADSGWGMEVLNFGGDVLSSTVFVLVYYPSKAGLPTWGVASGTLANGTANLQLLARSNGYCRTCTPPAASETTAIGNLTLKLNPPGTPGAAATGTASFTINYPDGGSFSRSNDAITMLSLPPGQ
jgi:hypothetical protein